MAVRNFIFIFFLFCLCTDSFGQLQVTANNNPASLAQTLAGPGVNISSATLNCPSNANPPASPTGTFVGTASNIGITSGVLLTTGDIKNAIGPNSTYSITTNNNYTFNDPDLMAIEPKAINDVCILEFDVTPACSTLAFTFAFGSDEYPEFVPNSLYNDVFGIFVTGPNPAGGTYNAYNMALIPSTTTPVSIHNINNGTACPATSGPCNHCAYYVDNCTGSTIEYDGFTKPINLTLNVKPCTSYHFKLAIADAGDFEYDSGVFFAFQSLACNPLPILVGTSSTPSACTSNNGSAMASPTGGTAPYTYSWNTSPPQSTQTAVGLSPGNYTVMVTDNTGCFFNTGTVTVSSVGGFATPETHNNVTCFGNNDGSATITPAGGNIPYTYSWSTSPVQISPTISNISAGSYTCTITDAAGCVETETVTVVQPPPIIALITNTVNVSCPGGNDGGATASASGGASPYNYLWNSAPPQAGAVASNLTAGNFMVTVTDANGCTATQSVSILQPPAMNLPTSATEATCGLSDGSATVNPSGGAAPYTYLWLTTPVVQTTPTATNLTSGTYSVIITDSKGCLQTQTAIVPGGSPPLAAFTFSPDTVSLLDPNVQFYDASAGTIASWTWNFGDANSGVNDTSDLENPLHAYSDTGTYCITLMISSASGPCADTLTKCLRVDAPVTFYIPNAFTPNHDGINELFMAYGMYIKEFHMTIFDRWGNKVFETEDIHEGWNGTVKNKSNYKVQEDVYVWKVKLTDTNLETHTYIGNVTVLR